MPDSKEMREAQLRQQLRWVLASLHDQKGPATITLLLLELAAAADSAEERAQHLAAARREQQMLLLSVETMIALESAPDQQPPLSQVDLSALLEDVANRFSPLLLDKPELHIAMEIADDLVLSSANANLVRRVVENLMGNAIKYSTAGTICLRAGHSDSDNRLWFEVRDPGQGFSPERLAQVRGYLTDPPKELPGFGLYFVSHAVEKMNGVVQIQSGGGAGSSVRVELPQ